MTTTTSQTHNTPLSQFVSIFLGASLAAAGIIIALTAEPGILTGLAILLYLPAGGFLAMGISRLLRGNRMSPHGKKPSAFRFLDTEVTIPGATRFLEYSVAHIMNRIAPNRIALAAQQDTLDRPSLAAS